MVYAKRSIGEAGVVVAEGSLRGLAWRRIFEWRRVPRELEVAFVGACKVRVYADVSVMRFAIDYTVDEEASVGFRDFFSG